MNDIKTILFFFSSAPDPTGLFGFFKCADHT